MNYQETIELEQNIKIKNEANEVYNDFIAYFSIFLSNFNFEQKRFKIWDDGNNQTYLAIKDGYFEYQCRFLHETYNIKILPEYLFQYIKEDYRGYSHFKNNVERVKNATKTN